MASIASFSGKPTLGNVNSSPPFSFKASSDVRGDYGSRPTVSALQNPTLHNSVPETMVNSTARAPLFVRPFTRGYEKQYSEGDILFVKRGDERAARQHFVVANLPVLNNILRTEKDGDDLKYRDTRTEGGSSGTEGGSSAIDKILEDWNYFGILNNDMDTGSKWQRLLNVNVRGRSRVARLWSPEKKNHLRKGDQVWISFVKRDPQDTIQSFLNPNGIREAHPAKTPFFEAVPTMDCCEDFKQASMSFPVGIVSQVTLKKPSSSSLTMARYVTETCKSLERIEVLMRI